jgi:hypothetical protein
MDERLEQAAAKLSEMRNSPAFKAMEANVATAKPRRKKEAESRTEGCDTRRRPTNVFLVVGVAVVCVGVFWVFWRKREY